MELKRETISGDGAVMRNVRSVVYRILENRLHVVIQESGRHEERFENYI